MSEEFTEERLKKYKKGICIKNDCEEPKAEGHFLCRKHTKEWETIFGKFKSNNDAWMNYINEKAKKPFVFR